MLATRGAVPYFPAMTVPVRQRSSPHQSVLPSMTTTVIAVATGFVLAGTIALWMTYGDRVYFDTIMTGLASCFSF